MTTSCHSVTIFIFFSQLFFSTFLSSSKYSATVKHNFVYLCVFVAMYVVALTPPKLVGVEIQY